MNTRRVIFFVLTFAVVLLLPWYLSLVLLIAETIYFDLYIEVLFFGLLFDLLYSKDFSFPHIGLSLAFGFLLIFHLTRTQIRGYAS